jgi:hypothetical protein
MKSTNYKKLSIANLKLNKNYGNKISKIKKESSISQRQMNNIKNKSPISLSTPKSNMITKKNKENNSPINFNILKYKSNKKISPSHYNVNNNYSEYITLKKKNEN